VAVDGYTEVFSPVGPGDGSVADGKEAEIFSSSAAEQYRYCFGDVYSEAPFFKPFGCDINLFLELYDCYVRVVVRRVEHSIVSEE